MVHMFHLPTCSSFFFFLKSRRDTVSCTTLWPYLHTSMATHTHSHTHKTGKTPPPPSAHKGNFPLFTLSLSLFLWLGLSWVCRMEAATNATVCHPQGVWQTLPPSGAPVTCSAPIFLSKLKHWFFFTIFFLGNCLGRPVATLSLSLFLSLLLPPYDNAIVYLCCVREWGWG